ncbi:MAG: hypothetical protein IJZ57_05455 [Clostridia bacterium]|nr:hypothetical protein [Clostridia bacterium]
MQQISVLSYKVTDSTENPLEWQMQAQIMAETVMDTLPDCVGIQQAGEGLAVFAQAHLGELYSYVEGNVHNPIFYNHFELTLLESGSFWYSDTPGELSKFEAASVYSSCSWAAFERKECGTRFMMLNTAFDKNPLVKAQSIPMLMNVASKYYVPVVCTGEFNMIKGAVNYRTLTAGVLRDVSVIAEKTQETPAAFEKIIPDVVYNYIPEFPKFNMCGNILSNYLVEPLEYGHCYQGMLYGEQQPNGVIAKLNLLRR